MPISNKWFEIEEKYNIRFTNEDGSFRTVDEWLDDLYLQCPSRCLELIEEIMIHGDDFFAHLISHQE